MSTEGTLKMVYDALWELRKVKNQSDFSKQLSYDKGYISKLMSEEYLPIRLQSKLTEVFGIDAAWLKSGGNVGTMFASQPNAAGALVHTAGSTSEDDDLTPRLSDNKEVILLGKQVYRRLRPDEYNEAFKDWAGVPMYNVPVTASFVDTYRDERAFTPQYYLHDPRFKDCNFGAIITGDSMYSEIRHGDFVVCQEITDKDFVVFGEIYYIVSTNGLETCKYLNADPEDKNNFLLVPRNDKISPSPLPKRMIQRLFKVRGVLRGY